MGRRLLRKRPRHAHRARRRAATAELDASPRSRTVRCRCRRSPWRARRTPPSATPASSSKTLANTDAERRQRDLERQRQRDVGSMVRCGARIATRRATAGTAPTPGRCRCAPDAAACCACGSFAESRARRSRASPRSCCPAARRRARRDTSARTRGSLDVVDEVEHLLRVYGTRALRFTVGKRIVSRRRPACFLAMILGSLRTHGQETASRRELDRAEQEGALRLFHRGAARGRARACRAGRSRACAPAKRS